MLSYQIYKMWIRRHCCPRKCLGNKCRCDSILMIFKTDFHFSFFLFFLTYNSVDLSLGLYPSCTWCWNLLYRGWKHFHSKKEFSNYLKKPPQIQILILFFYIHKSVFSSCLTKMVVNCVWKAAVEICRDLIDWSLKKANYAKCWESLYIKEKSENWRG